MKKASVILISIFVYIIYKLFNLYSGSEMRVYAVLITLLFAISIVSIIYNLFAIFKNIFWR